MSGGYFDYKQFELEDIADSIERVINNKDNDQWPDSVLDKFEETVRQIRRTATMITRIDWLLEGDDGIETFLERWAEEIDSTL